MTTVRSTEDDDDKVERGENRAAWWLSILRRNVQGGGSRAERKSRQCIGYSSDRGDSEVVDTSGVVVDDVKERELGWWVEGK